jgi:hypothetical protein
MKRLVSGSVLADLFPDLPGGQNTLLLAGGAAAALVVLLLLVLLLRGGKRRVDPEAGLAEDLSTYPPPPKRPGDTQVAVMGQPGRLRLVVVAPVGKRPVGEPEEVLEQVVPGLGEVAGADKPRLRVWPPQLSSQGFAPTFFRLTSRPGPEGKASRWVLLAGPARAGAVPVLLGLAVLLDAPSKLGLLTLDERRWAEVLRLREA